MLPEGTPLSPGPWEAQVRTLGGSSCAAHGHAARNAQRSSATHGGNGGRLGRRRRFVGCRGDGGGEGGDQGRDQHGLEELAVEGCLHGVVLMWIVDWWLAQRVAALGISIRKPARFAPESFHEILRAARDAGYPAASAVMPGASYWTR